MIAVLVINYRTADATLACLASVLPQLPPSGRIHLLDNGSGGDDDQRLAAFALLHPGSIVYRRSPDNLGFAAGMNHLIAVALADARCEQILLLNSDTIAEPGFIAAMQLRLDPPRGIDMCAARLLHASTREVESLGITLYRSTLASNRTRESDRLLGPTGGCALLTRRLLEDLHAEHGEWFDASFFCYAEDTDLMARARGLGYQSAYAGDAIVLHHRSLSSGGADSPFVLYHGIRNSIWWLFKNAPTGWLLRSLPLFVVLHAAIVVRHLLRGNGKTVWQLYRDAIRGMPDVLRKRRTIQARRRVAAADFDGWVQPDFYDRDYLARAWRELWRRG